MTFFKGDKGNYLQMRNYLTYSVIRNKHGVTQRYFNGQLSAGDCSVGKIENPRKNVNQQFIYTCDGLLPPTFCPHATDCLIRHAPLITAA